MTQRFLDKTVLITGGGSGIGRETAIQFASEGAYVIIFDMDTQGAEEVVGTIIDKGGKADFLKVDVSNSSIVNDYVSELSKKFEIDILVNNAGIAHIGTIEQTTEQDLDRIYNVNVKGCYNLMHAVIPQMKQRKQGVILNIASIASSVGIKDRFAYSMSKGAVLTMTYSVAKDYISDGIRCNCIAPARVHTPFVDNFFRENLSR
ncbi:SDR family NAD(P)-dependent oxidoreductase [Pseudoalteromonas phenolica]|uniref:SDR family NAD(P)-dependent oxidoreductase n=1 Tax=Pseudoalteromonas phenolica TaxID=161398 RepID=UPI00240DA2FC|nr:SDR family oxidoreductase [Pseudoalteromonas phenolica]